MQGKIHFVIAKFPLGMQDRCYFLAWPDPWMVHATICTCLNKNCLVKIISSITYKPIKPRTCICIMIPVVTNLEHDCIK